MARMPKLSLEDAVVLIALNDEPTCLKSEQVMGMASVAIVADIYGLTQRGLARKVVKYRMDMCVNCHGIHAEDMKCKEA